MLPFLTQQFEIFQRALMKKEKKNNYLIENFFIEQSEKMIRLLPKIKGMPDDFVQKVEKRKDVFQATSEEHSKIRCEFLTQKIKFDTLLDLSLSTDDKDGIF